MIKDILVTLPVGGLSDGAVNYAVSVAEAFDAHLTGMAFVHTPFVPGTVFGGAGTGFIATYRAQVEKAAKAAVAKFEDFGPRRRSFGHFADAGVGTRRPG